jgi:type 1 glutamine amidotransferase
MRRRAFLLASAAALAAPLRSLRVLVVTGENHYHESRATTAELRRILEFLPGMEVRVNEDFTGATAATLAAYDVVLLNLAPREPEKARWGLGTERAFFEAIRKGKGAVIYHYALGFRPEMNEEYELLCGGTWRPGFGQHSPRHDFPVRLRRADHPVLRGVPPEFVHRNDELYANLKWHPEAQVEVLATGWDEHALYGGKARQPTPGEGLDQPVLWTHRYGGGRVFVTALGHDVEAMQNPYFRLTLLRGVEWAGGIL